MPDAQPDRLGKYEILAEIGKGGFATVYRARDTDLGREVALKVLDPLLMRDPAWVARFRQEARTIAALDHLRIVPIYEIGQAEGILFIAMKLLEGGSLADRIKAGPLPWAEVVRLTGEIAEGLDFAHSRKVLHRDLKPSNVLLDADGHAVLTDFGFARLVADHSLSVSVSGGGVVGTPAYIAPEVWEGEPPGRPADLYALGCIVYEMASGVQPFTGATTPAVMRAHFQPLKLPEHWPAGTPAGLGDVLAVALAQAPADRFTSAGELAAAVAGLTIDALAEPYAALEAAVVSGDWAQARTLAGQVRAQKPDYRDVAALEAQALAGQERAARAEQAATWRAEAESALDQGDRSGAALAARQWTELIPDDPALTQFQARLRATRQPAAASPDQQPKSARAPLWTATAGTAGLVLLVAALLLTRLGGQEKQDLMVTPTATLDVKSTAIALAPSTPLTTDTPSPTDAPTESSAPTTTPLPTETPTVTPTKTPTLTTTPTATGKASNGTPAVAVVQSAGTLVEIPLESRYVNDLVAIDTDGDSQDELIILAQDDEGQYGLLSIYDFRESTFTITYQSRVFGGIYNISLCDMSVIGQLDILASAEGLQRFSIVGDGTLAHLGAIVPKAVERPVCEDLDRDGRTELVLGSVFHKGGYLEIYRRNPSSDKFYSARTLSGTDGSNEALPIDFDGDEQTDIVNFELYSGDVRVFKNYGDLDFKSVFDHQFGTRVFSMAVADFDDDGFGDFVVAEAWSRLHFFRNDSGRGFTIPYRSSSIGSVFHLAVADLNHDQLPDVIAAPFEIDGKLYYYENQRNFKFQERVFSTGSSAKNYGLAVGDFDGDGTDDLAFGEDPVIVVFGVLGSFR